MFFLPDGKEKVTANFVQLGVYTEVPNEWTAYTIDLSNLGEGQVVFRHFNSDDRWALYIDDVTIFDQIAVDHPEQYNWVNMPYVRDHPHQIFGLESGTKYEMQMRVEPADWGESVFFTTVDPLVLENNADNSTVLSDNPGYTDFVKLNDRTLYKDGSWNTLCLPFDLTLSGSVLDGDGVELMTLEASEFIAETGTLYLDFVNVENIEDCEPYIKAGKPYLIRWDKPVGYDFVPSAYDIVNPVFSNVTVSNQVQNIDAGDVTFCGTFSPIRLEANDRTKLYLGSGDNLYYPSDEVNVNACRAYFSLNNGITAGDDSEPNQARVFVLNFGNDGAAGISQKLSQGARSASAWYSVDGRKLSGKPTQKGLYIHNGKKVVK